MASGVYTSFKVDLFNAANDLDAVTINMMLVTASYTFSAAHAFRSDLSNEVTGTGYSSGGQSLTTLAITSGTTTKFSSDAVTWTTSSITARAAILYVSTGLAATDALLVYIDFGSDKTSSGGDFSVTPSANGWFNVSG